MDGRHRTPWPDRPRSSLPSVAWWTGQGNCFEAHCAELENVDHAATFATPGFPACPVPADSLLPPRSPVPGQAPRLRRRRASRTLVPSSVRRSIRQCCAVVSRLHRMCRKRPRSHATVSAWQSSPVPPGVAATPGRDMSLSPARLRCRRACAAPVVRAFAGKKSPALGRARSVAMEQCCAEAIRSSGADRPGTTCRSRPRAPRRRGRSSA